MRVPRIRDAIPLLITHGWPGSVMEFLDVIEPLQRDFHVIAPSLPGFAFSGETSQKGWHPRRIAEAFADVMAELGYERYGLQGGDWGSAVSSNIADLYPDRVIGLHLNMVIARPVPDAPLLDDEKDALDRAREWRRTGTGYQEIQGTRPQSLGYALQDSPAGLAAWIVEKFQDWSDGDIADAYTFDRLLDNVMAYWVTGTAASSLRIYWEMRQNGPARHPAGSRHGTYGRGHVSRRDRVPAPFVDGGGVQRRPVVEAGPRWPLRRDGSARRICRGRAAHSSCNCRGFTGCGSRPG